MGNKKNNKAAEAAEAPEEAAVEAEAAEAAEEAAEEVVDAPDEAAEAEEDAEDVAEAEAEASEAPVDAPGAGAGIERTYAVPASATVVEAASGLAINDEATAEHTAKSAAKAVGCDADAVIGFAVRSSPVDGDFMVVVLMDGTKLAAKL